MIRLIRRYAHVPLGFVSLLVIVFAIAWLLARGVDDIWDLRLVPPVPAAIPITPTPTEMLTTHAPLTSTGSASVLPESPAPPRVTVELPRATRATERYALETGPFTSPEAADRLEDQLNRLGYATIRFRKQALTRLYVVAVTGFGSIPEAKRASAQLGHGAVVEAEQGVEVLLDRLPSLHEAITAARALRGRGFDVRVDEEVGPALIYQIRYGQFTNKAAAEARSEELALFGVASRVVKVR